jgi:hypothetical protein
MFNLFGSKKKRRIVAIKGKKPKRSLLIQCKKLHIKVFKKIGKNRYFRKSSILSREVARKKARKGKKGKKGKRTTRRKVRRRFRFGDASTNSASFNQPQNYGYKQAVPQVQGTLSQSSQVVTAENNINRPPGFGLDASQIPTYGVYRPFFTEQVPTQVGPNSIGFMGQPDGSLYPVGGPFSRYTSFGKRRRRYRRRF